MNIEKLRELYEAAKRTLHERKTALDEAHKRVMEAPDETVDTDLEAFGVEFDTAATSFDEAAEEVERTKRNLADAERRERVAEENPASAAVTGATPRGQRTELAYRPDTHSQADVVRDAYAAFCGDPEARERQIRNNREQEDIYREKTGKQLRDVGTGAFAGLTVPQYLLDEYAPLARAGAPFLAAVPQRQLPASGMTLNISRITTGSGVAAQASENAAVQETDMDDTLLTINIRQYAGQQDVSRQAVERSEGVVQAIFEDLTADWFTKVDSAIINADGTSGTVLGVRSTAGIVAVTYTDATPTVPEFYPKLADAIQQIASGRFAPATSILMHPRRWGWGTAALDSSNRPLFIPDAGGPHNALAVGNAPEYGAVVGQIQGLPVVTDANIPTNLGTNEDVILVMRMPDLRVWLAGDGMPRRFTFEQSNAPQSVRLAIWGEVAFSAGKYPLGNATIGGSGLILPTF
jgi:HK97 family phage major capsid protein